MTERMLIVNADDFGLAPGVSRGILEAHRIGVVTSTSALVTLPTWSMTARALQHATPSLGVGLHFDIVTGRPLVADSTLACRETGGFHSYPELLRRILTGRIDCRDVERECEAQIARLRAALLAPGQSITHIDSHRHTHVLPVIATGMRRAARRASIATMRYPVERLMRGTAGLGQARVVALRALASFQRASPAAQARDFLGAAWQGSDRWSTHLVRIGELLRAPVTELMCHPGYVDDALQQIDSFTHDREAELDALCRPGLRAEWKRCDIRLVHFGELVGLQIAEAPGIDQNHDRFWRSGRSENCRCIRAASPGIAETAAATVAAPRTDR